MDINSLTLGEIKSLSALVGGSLTMHPYKLGQAYLIRTVTMTYTGRVTAVHAIELELSEACWIADCGRFNKALAGEWDAASEHEPFPAPIIIGRSAIIDACPISFKLPSVVK